MESEGSSDGRQTGPRLDYMGPDGGQSHGVHPEAAPDPQEGQELPPLGYATNLIPSLDSQPLAVAVDPALPAITLAPRNSAPAPGMLGPSSIPCPPGWTVEDLENIVAAAVRRAVALPCPYVPMSVAWPQQGQYITLKQEIEPMIDFIDLENSEDEMVLAKEEEGWSAEVEEQDTGSSEVTGPVFHEEGGINDTELAVAIQAILPVTGPVFHEEGGINDTELAVAIQSILPTADLQEGLGSGDASGFGPAITVAPEVLKENLKVVPSDVSVVALNVVVTATPLEVPRPDTIPEVGGSTPALDVPAGVSEGPRTVERVMPAVRAVMVEADTSIAGNFGLGTVPTVGGSTPELGVPAVLREDSSSIATPDVQSGSPNNGVKEMATAVLVPKQTAAVSTSAPVATKPRGKGETRQLPAEARLKTIRPKTDPGSDRRGGRSEDKPNPPAPTQSAVTGKNPNAAAGIHKSAKNPPAPTQTAVTGKNPKAAAGFHKSAKNPPAPIQTAVAGKKPTAAAGFHKSAKNPPAAKNAARRNPTEPADAKNSEGAVPYTPSRLGNPTQYSPTFPQMDRANCLTQVKSAGQLHYHPTPLGQCNQSLASSIALKSGAEPAAILDSHKDKNIQSLAAGNTKPPEGPWLPNHSGFKLNPPVSTNGVAVGMTGSLDTSTPEAPTAVPETTGILSPSMSVASSHGGSDTPAPFRGIATGEEGCPPDHVLRGIVSFVAFDMGRWERGPMTAAIHREFGATGLTAGQCQAYGMVAMEALQAAATACQSRYETGDTNHLSAIQTWRRGIIRKIDRQPLERTASVESVSREWPGFSSKEPESGNHTPKRPRMGIPSEGLEFLELAPRPDMSYSPETVITSPRPGEWRRRPSATIVRPETIPVTVAPPQSVVGDALLSSRGDMHTRDLPNGMDARRANLLFPPPRRVGPVPSLLQMPVIQPTVNLPSGNLGPRAAWRTTYGPSAFTPPHSGDGVSRRSSISPTFQRLARRLTQDDRRLVRPPAPSNGNCSPSRNAARRN